MWHINDTYMHWLTKEEEKDWGETQPKPKWRPTLKADWRGFDLRQQRFSERNTDLWWHFSHKEDKVGIRVRVKIKIYKQKVVAVFILETKFVLWTNFKPATALLTPAHAYGQISYAWSKNMSYYSPNWHTF